jgi:hypothetical protein
LQNLKVRFWCAVSAWTVIGPVVFDRTLNSESYLRLLLSPFFDYLHGEENPLRNFVQDIATGQYVNSFVDASEEVWSKIVAPSAMT